MADPGTPTPDVPTQPRVKEALRASFPGVPIEETQRVGGVVYTVTLWHYRVSVSLTSRPTVPMDPMGHIMVQFEFAQPGKPVELLRTTGAVGMVTYENALVEIRSQIAGVAATLIVALDPPPDPPKTQFFGA